MIIGTRTGGPTNGLGTSMLPDLDNMSQSVKLIQNVHFKCDPGTGPSAHACYGVGNAHALFMWLQQQINRFAEIAPNKFKPLVVDGFIGNATVAALVLAMKKAPLSIGFALDPGWDGLTKERVAAGAANLAGRLNAAATMLSAPAPAPAPVSPDGAIATGQVAPTGQGGGFPQSPPAEVQPVPSPVPSPAATTNPKPQSNTVWWIVGGLAALAAAGIVTATVIRAKRRRNGGAHSFAAPHFGNPDIFPFPY